MDYETRTHRNAPAGRGAGRGLHDRRPYASAYADYTRHVVEQAVSRYESNGLDSTLAHYNRPESGGIGADATGELELKHMWVVRHDGLPCASGWYTAPTTSP